MIDLKQCSLGIELGSTRIKAVLVGDTCKPVAQGDFTWENRLENGIWTYPLEEVWQGETKKTKKFALWWASYAKVTKGNYLPKKK